MYKLLMILSITSVSNSTLPVIYKTNNVVNKLQGTNVWSDINIDHSVETPATGTHTEEDNKTDFTDKSEISWDDVISKSDDVIVHGDFEYNTHKDPIVDSEETLTKQTTNDPDEISWMFTKTNDHWAGWGHQTSTIRITLDAKYIASTQTVSLQILSYIYARTAGSVHSCGTISKITDAVFVPELN